MYRRIITKSLKAALSDSPVVLLNGARQTGKTTLVQSLEGKRTYLTFDDAGVLSAAKDDPVGFLAGFTGPVTLDEIQHVPELFPAIKATVDRNRVAGRFLLTGSANILLLPRLSESLAGRMEILTLWPLAQTEIEGMEIEGQEKRNVIDRLFADEFVFGQLPEVIRADVIHRVLLGGYPEPRTRTEEARRRAWFGAYLTTILQRDIRDMANIEGLTALPRLLSLLATRTGTLLNLADISRTSGLAYTTLTRYMTLLEATFLIQLLPAWSANLGKRMVKSPKILLCDTGLAAGQLGLTAERMIADGSLLGGLLETFVAMELRKAAGGSLNVVQFFHSRTQTGEEVDVLLEDGAGRLVGIEVKASATITSSDFKGLRAMAQAAPDQFLRGVVFYTGSQVIPFGERLHAVPLSMLWQ